MNIIPKTENDNINWIYHIADIHIKNDIKREKEYIEAFENVYNRIKYHKNTTKKNTYTVIAGDLLDDSIKLKAMSLHMLTNFLINLSKINRLFIISGNHDNNIKGYDPSESIDSLSAIFNIMEKNEKNTSRIHYLRDTGIYKAGNIMFYVPSVFDLEKHMSNSKEDWDKRIQVLPKKIEDPNCHHIMLGHFSLDGTPVQNGYLLRDQFFKVSDIESRYDLSLLGDNHKVNHILGEKENIGYPGSLLQLTSGEQLQGHGMLLWNLTKLKSMFLEIDTSYGFVTLDTTQDNFKLNLKPFPKNIRIKIKYNDNIKFEKIQKKLSKQTTHNILDINPEYIGNNNDIIESLSKIDIKNKDNFNLFLQSQYENQNLIEEISQMHLKYTKKLDIVDNIDNKTIQLNKLIIENFICFPNKVTINFDDFQKYTSIGILGKNHQGKSTIIKAIRYIIQGSSSLDSLKSSNIKNIYNKKKKCYVSLDFTYGGMLYRIERTTKKKESLSLKIFKNNKWTGISVRKKLQTQASIYKIFGESDIMLETWLSEQTEYNSFLKRTSKDRVKIFKKLLNLSTFEKEIKNQVNADIRNINTDKKIIESHIDNHEQEIEKYDSLENIETQLTETITEKNTITQKIKKLSEEINQFKGKFSEILDSNEITILQSKLNNNKQTLRKIKFNETKRIVPDEFDFNFETKNNQFDVKISDIEIELTNLNEQLKPVDKIYNKSKLKNLASEQKNTLTKETKLTKKQTKYSLKLKTTETQILNLNLNSENRENVNENYKTYTINENLIDSLINKISRNKDKIKHYQNLIDNTNCKFNIKCSECKSNKQVLGITDYEKSLKLETSKFETNTLELEKLQQINEKLNKWIQIYLNYQKYDEYTKEKDNLLSKIKLIDDEMEIFTRKLSQIEHEIIKCNETICNIESNEKINDQYMEKEDQMYEIRDQRTQYNNDYNKYKNYQIELEQYKNQRLELENDNLLIEQKLVKYKEYIESIKSIRQKEKDVKTLGNDLIQIETKIMKLTNNITNLTNISKLLETEEIKQKKFIKKYHSLEAYKNIIQIYPSYLTNQIIEQFEMLVNSFLAKIMNFTLKINYDDKELIITKVDQQKNEYLSSTLSGAETFIVSCAIRFGLIRISKIAMCSAFCIDEGFGSLDENKIYQFKNKIFEFLTKQFHNVIVVTHIDEIKNCLNHVIEVTGDNDKKIRIYKNR